MAVNRVSLSCAQKAIRSLYNHVGCLLILLELVGTAEVLKITGRGPVPDRFAHQAGTSPPPHNTIGGFIT